ncbi:MAG: PKD domain-containing protein [Bacteroidota bacterium]
MYQNVLSKVRLLIFIACLLNVNELSATTRKVLFIGNSFTYTENMPNMVLQLATSMGDTLIYDQNTPSGYTFQNHSTDATTIAKIFSQQWDVVVLQEQSQIPAFSQAQVDTQCYPYAFKLDSMVHANRACSQSMFLMTWGYKNGDPTNCASYPPICTYAGMQESLRESYMQMALNYNALVAPVGMAWKMTRDTFPTFELYNADQIHPSVYGAYLEACVVYASIFHKNPIYSSYYNTALPVPDAQQLQRMAGKMVFDSFETWQQHSNYSYANDSYNIASKTVTFQNLSQGASTYSWDFGDGFNSTQTNPVHTYASYGQYISKLTASNNCFNDTRIDTIKLIDPNSVATTNNGNISIRVVTQMGGKVSFKLDIKYQTSQLSIYDLLGKKLRSYDVEVGISEINDVLNSGIYIYKLEGDFQYQIGKLLVY